MAKMMKSLGVGPLGLCAALALAGCAQPPGMGPSAAPGGMQGAAQDTMNNVTGSVTGFFSSMMRARPSAGSGQAAGGGAAAGTGAVSDPFAGQPPAQPGYPPPGTAASPAPAGNITATTLPPSGTAAPAVAPAQSHTVAAGETAWSIARRYGVSVADLAAANGLPASMNVRLGQRLTIPAAGTRTAEAVTAPGAGSPTPLPPSASQPLPRETTQPASKPQPAPNVPNMGATRTAASGSGKFRMPADGSIIRTYQKGKNDGIDISAAPGASVNAAGSGTVAAITRDTEGTPIVVVRHDGGLMTVYAGLENLTVNKGDSVKAGQAIGKARGKGVVHFEVRQGFESVDPEKYL